MIIAIDGPAASGKGTLARKLAAHYGYAHLDTGLLYRGVGRIMLDRGFDLANAEIAATIAEFLDPADLDPERLRGAEMGEAASVVAAHPPVRAALLDLQRRFAAQAPGAVLDGRDIGSVICPDAELKIFVTASPEERARRRHLELQGRGEDITFDMVLADIRKRDERDSSRSSAPLVVPDDAIRLDTTHMGPDAVLAFALARAEERRNARS